MSFMTDKIVTEILRLEHGGSGLEILDRRLENGIIKPGENYCCEASRYIVNYEKNGDKRTKSIFLKIPYNVRLYKQLREKGLYQKELYMYRFVLPFYRSLLPDDIIAPCYYCSDDKEAIVLEDLSESGYSMGKRHKQLGFEHCVLAFVTLAKFHALSVKLHETNPEILDPVREESIFTSSFPSNVDHTTHYTSRFTKVADRLNKKYGSEYAETFEYYRDHHLIQSAIDALKPKENSFNVLNHGDFWTNNIMFKYDTYGRVSRAKLIDFQLCKWTSPVIDIFHFTINCMKFEVFEKYFYLLLQIYIDTLNAVLKHLQCSRTWSMEELKNEIKTKYNYAILVLVGITPAVVANPDCDADGFDVKLLDEESYVELSSKWFSYFIENGAFSKYRDTVDAKNTFINCFQEQEGAIVTKHELEEDIIKGGNNFCSGISRLKIEYEKNKQNHHKSVLLKIPSLSPNYEEIRQTEIYNREIYAYKIMLPKMYELWDGPTFTPHIYAVTDSKVLVLEDLLNVGYETKDKRKQLDLAHCRVALRTLAQYHALSVKFLETNPDCYREISAESMGRTSLLDHFLYICYDKFLATVTPFVSTSLLDKLQHYRELAKNSRDLYFAPHHQGLNVIVHGDFWLNNILFIYDDQGNVSGTKLIDWQVCRKISPAVDLIYFFVSSVQFTVYKNYYDTLLNFYIEVFNETLSSLKSNCKYTRMQLNDDIVKYKFFYISTIAGLLQILMKDDSLLSKATRSTTTTKDELSPTQTSLILEWLHFLEAENIL